MQFLRGYNGYTAVIFFKWFNVNCIRISFRSFIRSIGFILQRNEQVYVNDKIYTAQLFMSSSKLFEASLNFFAIVSTFC